MPFLSGGIQEPEIIKKVVNGVSCTDTVSGMLISLRYNILA